MILKLKNSLKGGIAKKIVVFLFAFGIVPLGVLAFVFFSFYFEGQKQGIIDVQKEIGERVSNSINAYLEKTLGQIKLFTSMLNQEVHNKNELHNLSYTLLDQAIEFDEIVITDIEGNEISKISRYYTFRPFELGKLAFTKAFQRAMEGKIHISQVEISKFSKFPLVRITAPIVDKREQISGVLVAGVNIVKMWNFISKYSIGENRYAYIVDPQGFLIAYQDLSSVLQKRDLNNIEGVSNLLKGKIGVFDYEGLVGERVIGANALIPLTRWGVIVEETVKDAYQDLYELSAVFLMIFIMTILLAVFWGLRFSYKEIINPIKLFQEEAEAIAKSEFTRKIDLKTSDELAQLAKTFNQMADDLSNTTVSRDVLVQEISEREKTEEALKKSEATLRSIFSAAPIGIGLVSNRILQLVNDQLCNIVGYTSDELIGQSARMLYPTQEEFERVGKEKYFQISKHGTGTVETLWQQKNGDVINVLLSSTPLDVSDWSAGVTFTALDITERKLSEEALRASVEIVRAIPSGLFMYQYVPPDRLILLDGNPAAEKLTGININQWRGKDFNEIWPKAQERGIFDSFLKVMKTGKIYEIEDLSYKDERLEGAFSMRAFPMPGERLGVAFESITQRKRAEQEKEKLETQLRQAYKMESIGTLAGGIAHDFNNILAAVIGYTELALEDTQKETQLYENLQEVLLAGSRASDLVKQILTFSRQTDQEQNLIQIKLIVIEALKLLRASIPSTIEIRQDVQSNALVIGDSTQIHQVLMNLCTNAAHAMEDNGGLLTVNLSDVELDSEFVSNHPDLKPGPYINLTVTDTGHGIPPSILERIFDPFFTTKEKGKGTGMGLSVVHGIVHSHEGAIYCYSELGKGSTFKVYLPAVERGLKSEERVERPIPTGIERILFIDDEPAIVNMGERILKSLGYDVTTRTGSIEALKLFKAQKDRFDLVITDMTMPQMTGENLSKELMKIRPDIPIILCTGFSARVDEKKALGMGIKAFVTKPILKRKIAETIRAVLDNL